METEKSLMPRIYDSASDPIDFCKRCYPTEQVAFAVYGDEKKTGEGPDGRGNCFGYDAEHPPYEDEEYDCTDCGKRLKERDN
jgi:hypothetical protein